MLKNQLILQAAKGETTPRTPVWLMRQAGRILPQYREVRSKAANFIEFVKNPDWACEVSIQPVDILGVDAAIIFSDILVVPEAMGCAYEMIEKRGPLFPKPIQHENDLQKLRIADPHQDLGYVLDAIRLTKKNLDNRVPLIGFAGAPFTIFAYMVEGSGSKTFSKAKQMLYQRPDLAHQLLQKITDTTIAYLKAQTEAGADLIQIFDSWAGILSPEQYQIFSLPYISQICEAIQTVPKTVFAKGAFFALKQLGELDCQTIGLDWNMDIKNTRKLITTKTLQGNLDPCALYADFDQIRKETAKMLQNFGKRHIANLGHGVYPDTDPEKVRCFIDTVKELSSNPKFFEHESARTL